MCAIAYRILQETIIRSQGPASLLKQAIGSDLKGWLSVLLYIVGIGSAVLRSALIAQMLYTLVALLWLIPDRRIERTLSRRER
jgi:hypothetical protein